MSTPAIGVKEVSYSYDKILAVAGISFEVAEGEVMGFLGPNGAGKSTTIKMLTGMLKPKTGTVNLLGLDMAADSDKVRERIGVCFEEKNLYLEMTGRENLEFFAKLFGIKKYDARTALERVGLAERMNDRVKKYSKGMRQRLMIARALVNRPDILFLDEPTDGLDPVSSRAIRRVIQEEAERGAAVFLTTHDMMEADLLSDRVAFIDKGKIAALDTPENLKLKYGKRTVKIRHRSNGDIQEKVVELSDEHAGQQLKEAVGTEGLLTIHTEEATLEDIFVLLTGRGLA